MIQGVPKLHITHGWIKIFQSKEAKDKIKYVSKSVTP